MSNPVTALNGAQFSGLVDIVDAGLTGMITLRGDLASAAIVRGVKSATGAKMPADRNIATATKGSALWMSPDELLLIVDYASVDDTVAKLSKSIGKTHHLAVNVSDARAVFDLSGKGLRDVLAKGAPADVSADALPVGEIRRTRIGQLPVAFWFSTDTTAHLICFRSVGAHVFDWLTNAAKLGSAPDFNA